MKWRIDISRKANGFTKPGQAGRRIAIEVVARDATDAASRAMLEMRRLGYALKMFDMSIPVRK